MLFEKLYISRTKQDKFAKQKETVGRESDIAQDALKCCNVLIAYWRRYVSKKNMYLIF
jgi:hypothetical protein